jgi:hypothetical protein
MGQYHRQWQWRTDFQARRIRRGDIVTGGATVILAMARDVKPPARLTIFFKRSLGNRPREKPIV